MNNFWILVIIMDVCAIGCMLVDAIFPRPRDKWIEAAGLTMSFIGIGILVYFITIFIRVAPFISISVG